MLPDKDTKTSSPSSSPPPPPPPKPHISRSFSRLEDASTNLTRTRTGVEVLTAANSSLEENPLQPLEDTPQQSVQKEDIRHVNNDQAAASHDGASDEEGDDDDVSTTNLPDELADLIERFIESLTKKTYSTPVSADNLSSLFQEFYVRAALVAAHVAANSYALMGSRTGTSKSQQMISISEMTQKKSQRKLVEIKAKAYEETVEETLTQRLYDKIWRHKSTDDEARDESLRSKTMALGLVGVGLKEFGLDDLIAREDLAPVTEALEAMDRVHFPRGKILELKKAHKFIVDCLSGKKSNTDGRSTSADQILPALIYSVMVSPPEINAISNLLFIQRFRTRKAVDGETAYCLTNFEAAISFLETVDLDSLLGPGSSEDGQGSTKIYPPAKPSDAALELPGTNKESLPSSSPKPVPAKIVPPVENPPPPTPTRRTPFLAPVEFATSAASSAVNTADQSIKTIGSTLESSYKFLFGKMSDRKTEVPRTLDDARKLVGTPTEEEQAGEQTVGSGPQAKQATHLPAEGGEAAAGSGNTVTLPFGLLGTAMQRVSSSDSIRSKGSAGSSSNPATKPLPKPLGNEKLQAANLAPDRASIPTPVNAAAEGVRAFGNHIGRLAEGGINVIRSPFSRSQSTPQTQQVTANDLEPHSPAAPPVDLLNTFPDLAAALPAVNDSASGPPLLLRIAPPDPRFLVVSPNDIRLGDIPALLSEYRRMADYLEKLGAFSESR